MEGLILNNVIEDGLFAAMASVGFASISHAPRRTYILCAVAAAAGHSFRYLLMLPGGIDMNIIMASAVAAFVVGIIAVMLAPAVKVPAEACLFPALLPMIPGMYAYRTVEALVACLSSTAEDAFTHDLYLLFTNGLTCVAIVFGMVLGATIPIFMLKRWSFQATRYDSDR